MSQDYYAILEVSPSANSREIKESYKRLALRWHPDKNSANRSEAESRFRRIAEAYQVLSDPGRRAAYDSARPDAQGGQQHGGGFGSGSGAFRQFQQPGWSAFRDPFFLYQEVFGSSEEVMSSGVTASLVSETTTVDGSGNVTVVKTTVDNGVKVVKVTRNGELVDQTTTVLNQLARR